MTETTYPVSVEEGPFGEPTETVVIHGAGDGNGPDDVLSDDCDQWNIAIAVKAVEDRSEYLAGLARIGFEPAGVDESGRELVRRVERIENWTPHPVRIVDADKIELAAFPIIGVARAAQTDEQDGKVADIPVVRTQFGKVVDLPEPRDGVYLIVSIITAQAARAGGRTTNDLLLTSGLVRDADGAIIGCRQLARVP